MPPYVSRRCSSPHAFHTETHKLRTVISYIHIKINTNTTTTFKQKRINSHYTSSHAMQPPLAPFALAFEPSFLVGLPFLLSVV